jgi:hypothetical protein
MACQDVTGADRAWATHYQVDNLVRYTKGSRVIGIRGGEYARVTRVTHEQNLSTGSSSDPFAGQTLNPDRYLEPGDVAPTCAVLGNQQIIRKSSSI